MKLAALMMRRNGKKLETTPHRSHQENHTTTLTIQDARTVRISMNTLLNMMKMKTSAHNMKGAGFNLCYYYVIKCPNLVNLVSLTYCTLFFVLVNGVFPFYNKDQTRTKRGRVLTGVPSKESGSTGA